MAGQDQLLAVQRALARRRVQEEAGRGRAGQEGQGPVRKSAYIIIDRSDRRGGSREGQDFVGQRM